MWTYMCVLERRAKRNSTICRLVCSKTTAYCLRGWLRPVPTGQVYSVRKSRKTKIKSWRIFVMMTEFTIRCGGYFIFTIFSQEAKPGWDSGQVPVCLGQKQAHSVPKSKNVFRNTAHPQHRAEDDTGSLGFTQVKSVCQNSLKTY